MAVTVRRGAAEDAPMLARMRWRWRVDDQFHAVPDSDRDAFVHFFTGWIVDHLATHVPFIAEVDGAVSGMAWLMLTDRLPTPTRFDRRAGSLQSVYVVPEARNTGVGSALLEAVLRDARARELELVTVHSSERAMPFYQRHGFLDGQRWLELRI